MRHSGMPQWVNKSGIMSTSVTSLTGVLTRDGADPEVDAGYHTRSEGVVPCGIQRYRSHGVHQEVGYVVTYRQRPSRLGNVVLMLLVIVLMMASIGIVTVLDKLGRMGPPAYSTPIVITVTPRSHG